MILDLSGIEALLLRALSILLLSLASYAANLLLRKLHIDLSTTQKAEMEDVAEKSLSWAFSSAIDVIAARGWDHLEVKGHIINKAMDYAVGHFPDAMKRANVSTTDTTAASNKMRGLFERKYNPAIQTEAAATTTSVAEVAAARAAIKSAAPVSLSLKPEDGTMPAPIPRI